MSHNTRVADERFMPTEGITPMEKQIAAALISNHGLFIDQFEFRQRVSCYHLRYFFWKKLPAAAFAQIREIASQHGYRMTESVTPDDDKFTRVSYALEQVSYVTRLPVEVKKDKEVAA